MYTLPKLNYEFDSLEPYIDQETLTIHYGKHHQTYCDKLNVALENYSELANQPADDLLRDLEKMPTEIKTAIKNFGGGFVNHNFFWEILTPPAGARNMPEGELAEKINGQFGSFENFKKEFSQQALSLFGSGWTWLIVDNDKNLKIINTVNQESPLSIGFKPLLTMDVWEHAYYLKYQNRRAEFIEALWPILNWDQIKENYEKAVS